MFKVYSKHKVCVQNKVLYSSEIIIYARIPNAESHSKESGPKLLDMGYSSILVNS